MTTSRRARAYDRVARIYEPLGRLYSGGLIARAKAVQIDHMAPGHKVLYAGVGAGEDALLAARRGVQLTCIDVSEAMLQYTGARLAREQHDAELIHGDVCDHHRPEYYDVVAANFFLNAFSKQDMARMLRHSARLVRVGGKLLIADVAPPQGGLLWRVATRTYLAASMIPAWLAGLTSLHGFYDYRDFLHQTGLRTEDIQWFRLFMIGPIAYQSLTTVKVGPTVDEP